MTHTVEACVTRYTGHSYQLCFTLAPRFTNELLLTPNVSTTLRWSSSVVYTTMQYRHTHKYTTTIQKSVGNPCSNWRATCAQQSVTGAYSPVHTLPATTDQSIVYTDGRTPSSRFSPWGWLLIYQVPRVIRW